MDIVRIIQNHRQALVRLLVWMSALVGASGAIDRGRHREMLRRVRAMESAARRLIVAEARDLAVAVTLRLSGGRSGGPGTGAPGGIDRPGARFSLFDRRKRFEELARLTPKRPRGEPRITMVGVDDWIPQPGPMKIARDLNPDTLRRRIAALQAVLGDLPRHALRLARWRERQRLRKARGLPARPLSPMRPGFPPGFRRSAPDPGQEVLRDCQRLALWVEGARAAG